MLRLLVGICLSERDELHAFYRFIGHKVWENAFPTSWERRAMEIYCKAVIVSILKYVLVILHVKLLVTAKEIHLDAFDANTLHPFHLCSANFRVVHEVFGRLGCVVPFAVRIVP